MEDPYNPLSRRAFLALTLRTSGVAGGLLALIGPGAVEACLVPVTPEPWPSVDGWEHRTIQHFLNAVFPGDTGQALFDGDPEPLESGLDRTAGAWSACALDAFYDPYFAVTPAESRLLAETLDAATRALGQGTYFYAASQAGQLRVIDDLLAKTLVGPSILDVVSLCLSATLGAARNRSATDVIGWAGPNGGWYDGGKHEVATWRQPARMTVDGNLP